MVPEAGAPSTAQPVNERPKKDQPKKDQAAKDARIVTVPNVITMVRLSLLPVFLFFVAFQRLLVQGINTTGLKG